VRADEPLVRSLVETLRELKERHRLAGDVSVADVARFPGALGSPEAPPGLEEPARERLLGLLEQALEQLVAMSRSEGEHLRRELLAGLERMLAAAGRIEVASEAGKAERAAALGARARELAAGLGLDDGRLHQEIVRLAERSDVNEELVRLRSHAAQCREAVLGAGPSGKRLDFLAQELGREANTIGSKAASAAVVQEVVALKAEIERFREQVQNVE
jgi:uncharacterized protein (TIGR00255 family)